MSRPPGASRADAALRRGTAFVRAIAPRGGVSASPRVAGNILAELDRLLFVLIGQAALDRRIELPARSRDNAVRLSALHDARAVGPRLRALACSVSCLRRHEGRAHQADRRGCGFMTVGWSDEAAPSAVPLRRFKLGENIVPSAEQLDDVCAFYDQLAQVMTMNSGPPAR